MIIFHVRLCGVGGGLGERSKNCFVSARHFLISRFSFSVELDIVNRRTKQQFLSALFLAVGFEHGNMIFLYSCRFHSTYIMQCNKQSFSPLYRSVTSLR